MKLARAWSAAERQPPWARDVHASRTKPLRPAVYGMQEAPRPTFVTEPPCMRMHTSTRRCNAHQRPAFVSTLVNQCIIMKTGTGSRDKNSCYSPLLKTVSILGRCGRAGRSRPRGLRCTRDLAHEQQPCSERRRQTRSHAYYKSFGLVNGSTPPPLSPTALVHSVDEAVRARRAESDGHVPRRILPAEQPWQV